MIKALSSATLFSWPPCGTNRDHESNVALDRYDLFVEVVQILL